MRAREGTTSDHLGDDVVASVEYQAIAAHYGDRAARRSGVPLMVHIDEGLWILAQLGASAATRRAWCLHPLAQDPPRLVDAEARLEMATDDPEVRMLALVYRHIANATLSTRSIESSDDIVPPPRLETTQMLIADKVQNRKDFLRYHADTHPRRVELDRYFRLWCEHLGVTEDVFAWWCRALDERSTARATASTRREADIG